MSIIRFFHGCPQMGDVSVYIGGMPITKNLSFGESTPHFLMNSGQTTVRVVENGEVKLQNHVIVPENQSFTLMIVCQSGRPKLIAVAEDGYVAEPGSSGVRVAAFAKGEEQLELWRWFEGEEEKLFTQIIQGDVSEYAQIEAGEHRWEIRKEGGTMSIWPGHDVQPGRLYTVFLIGRSHPDEEEFPIAIRVLEDMKSPIATEGGV